MRKTSKRRRNKGYRKTIKDRVSDEYMEQLLKK